MTHILYEGNIPKKVILFGDPKRADLVKSYVDEFRELFYFREFRGIYVSYKEKEALLASTGIGGPSTAIAIKELKDLGGEEFIRVGTCGVFDRNIKTGDLIVALGATREEGTTKAMVRVEVPAIPSFELTNRVISSLERRKMPFFKGIVRTHDLFYESEEEFVDAIKKYKNTIIASEMEMSVVFITSLLLGAKAAGILVVNTPEYIDWDTGRVEDITYLEQSDKVKEGLTKAILAAIDA